MAKPILLEADGYNIARELIPGLSEDDCYNWAKWLLQYPDRLQKLYDSH